MDSRYLGLFFIIGIIIGPIYSITLYNQYVSDPLKSNYPYYNENKHATLLKENKSYIGGPSEISNNAVTIVNHTIYDIIHPSQIASNYTFQNYDDNGSQELLELNLSNDFSRIQSSENYLLPNFKAETGTSSNPQFSRPIFDGEHFWTIQDPDIANTYNQNSGRKTSFISFDKQGIIYTNQSFNVLNLLNLTPHPAVIDLGFIGIYQNYFIVDIPDNNSLLLIPKDNFNKTRMILGQDIVSNNPGFIISSFFTNIDNNGLIWAYGNVGSKNYFLGLSLNDIINTGKSNVKEIINRFDQYAMYPNALTNGSFHNIAIDGFGDPTYTIPVIENGRIFSLDYLYFQNKNNGMDMHILAGLDITRINRQKISPMEISVVLSGFLLLFSEGIIIWNQSRKKRKINNSSSK